MEGVRDVSIFLPETIPNLRSEFEIVVFDEIRTVETFEERVRDL
jgi:hypothetical protein